MKMISGSSRAGVLGFLVVLGVGGAVHAAPQIPDVYVYDVGYNGNDTNDIEYYGQSGGIGAYSIATQSCNKGTGPLIWVDSGGSNEHPVIAQNMFRLKNGRFEHIGQSWLKHGFCAVSEFETFCAPCQPDSGCDELGVGCADTYWATLNDGGSGRSKRFVNAASGVHTDGGPLPSGNATIKGRLQVKIPDIDPAQNPGAEYFIEGHYVTADDAAVGNSANNATWRRVVVNAINNITGGGPSAREEPAIYAWQDIDHDVTVTPVLNLENAGTKTLFLLGHRVTQTGPGVWHYEYAIQNLSSDQSAGSFSVPVDDAVNVTNIGFHDVDYHSGDPYDLTDWPGAHAADAVTWATTPYATNQNANALRWGTLYNWRFDADAAPVNGSVTLGLFKPGPSSSLVVNDVLVPEAQPHIPGVKHQLADEQPQWGGTVSVPFTASRTGTHGNPIAFSQTTLPVVGRPWKTVVQIDGATQTLLLISHVGPAQDSMTKAGELLIQPPFSTYLEAGEHVINLPNDPSLAGVRFWSQGAALTATGWQLTNALDVTIGTLQ